HHYPSRRASARGAWKMITNTAIERDAERRDALVGRLFSAAIGTMELLCVYLGDRLGLYQALADRGSTTAAELAAATGTDERYVHEWLEQQAASGLLDVDDPRLDAATRRYRLPAAYREVLLDADSLNCLSGLIR